MREFIEAQMRNASVVVQVYMETDVDGSINYNPYTGVPVGVVGASEQDVINQFGDASPESVERMREYLEGQVTQMNQAGNVGIGNDNVIEFPQQIPQMEADEDSDDEYYENDNPTYVDEDETVVEVTAPEASPVDSDALREAKQIQTTNVLDGVNQLKQIITDYLSVSECNAIRKERIEYNLQTLQNLLHEVVESNQ